MIKYAEIYHHEAHGMTYVTILSYLWFFLKNMLCLYTHSFVVHVLEGGGVSIFIHISSQ